MLSYPNSRLHLEDERFVDRMQASLGVAAPRRARQGVGSITSEQGAGRHGEVGGFMDGFGWVTT